jgi:ribosomal-protein-alanine N-acetyltransferase
MGFGSMMLEFAIELCQMSHVKNITLEVRVSNDEAKNLYEKYGFKPSHFRKQYYENGEDALVMNKELEVE